MSGNAAPVQGVSSTRVALVHDWLTGMRGGEKVLELLCEAYPTADLLTLFHVPGSVSPTIERMRPRTSVLQNVPGMRRFYRYCLPLFPAAIEQFDLDQYDLIISTSHCAAKSIVKTGRARHLCYCFTPMRYAWDQFDAYFGEGRVGTMKSRLLRPVLHALGRWDAATAGRVDRYVAISQHVASRIRRYYNREAGVIYPPVDTGFFSPDDTVATENFLLIVSALVPYKRIDVAIEASRLSGMPLRIIGDGPERAALTALATRADAGVQLLGSVSNEMIRDLYRRAAAVLLPGEEDFGIAPVEAQACGTPVIALARGGALETVVDGVTGVLVDEPTSAAFAAGIARAKEMSFDRVAIRAHAVKFDRAVFSRAIQSTIEDSRMLRRYGRLLVAVYVVSDAMLGIVAFGLAYLLRFSSGLIPVTRGYPPFEQYVSVMPYVAVLVPLAYYFQGVYRLRRGRSRVDDFFLVFIGTVVAVILGVVTTLYVDAYHASPQEQAVGAYQVSRIVWALFLVINIAFTFGLRELVREVLERRWKAGLGLKRILIAGAGDLGRVVAEKILQHGELGFHVIGFVDDRAGGDHLGYRGLPLLGTLNDAPEIIRQEHIDHLYVALPLDEHVKMLDLIESTSREMVDVKVVPDLVQFLALRARLEDLDGVPIINIHDVPLQGLNAVIKRTIDLAISGVGALLLAIPCALIALAIKYTSPGAVFYRQERMGLDGRPFWVYKFRSMHVDAEDVTGPIWAREDDPRCTPIGRFLRHWDFDELPQIWNVLKGDMSIVGPRPERPFFVDQFKHRFPQYMLRHKVKAGITGWAQVNGWRGNTSLEKRIEFDLYYIENWSVSLDLKIMWMTLFRGVLTR